MIKNIDRNNPFKAKDNLKLKYYCDPVHAINVITERIQRTIGRHNFIFYFQMNVGKMNNIKV